MHTKITMEDKLRERLEKLQALSERGVGGEKETAQNKLEELLRANGMTLEDLDDEKVCYFLFSYNGKHKAKLLRQCIYKILGAAEEISFYRQRGTRQKIGVYCTAAQKIEIELEYEFYSRVFDDELETFLNAFIQKQHIFPEDAPREIIDRSELPPEELATFLKEAAMADAIEKKTRAKLIEEH